MKLKVTQLCQTLCNAMHYSIRGIPQARILEWVAFPSPGDLSNPGIKPRSPSLQADSLPAEPQGKPRNTRVGSLSILYQIFPTQESNWGLLHCRQIFYQLSYQFSSVTRASPTLCDPMDCSTPGLPVHHQLPELTQTHVH